MFVKDQKDPRTYDWPEMANVDAPVPRAAGQVHARLHLRAGPARKLGNQRRRHRIHAACAPGRDLEQWRHVQRRRRDVQPSCAGATRARKAIRWRRAWARWSIRRRRRPRTARSRRSTTTRSRSSFRRPTSPSFRASRDYPGIVVHRDFEKNGSNLVSHPIGTGPFELVSYDVGSKVVLKRRENGKWWGGEAYLDGVEFIDYGPDPSADGQRLRGGRGRHQLRNRGRLCRHPRRAWACEVRGRHGGDDRGAHERQQQAL